MARRVFRSTDYSAPTMSGTVQSMINWLTAILVDGYGSQTLAGGALTGSGTTATLNVPIAHGWKTTAKITVAGATQSEFNGEFSATVTGNNQVTYTLPSAATVGTATGTITVKLAGCGWTKPVTGTNLAAFKQGAGSSGLYLRVDDTNAAYAIVRGYETMPGDINSGTGPFPSATQNSGLLYWHKSSTSDATARPWMAIADEGFLAFVIDINTNGNSASPQGTLHLFGDITSYLPGDQFKAIIKGATTTSFSSVASGSPSNQTTASQGCYMARGYTLTGSAITIGILNDYSKSGSGGWGGAASSIPFPNPVNFGLYFSKMWVSESVTGVLRGEIPGVWCPLHNVPLPHLETFESTGEYPGKIMQASRMYSAAEIFFEISDT